MRLAPVPLGVWPFALSCAAHAVATATFQAAHDAETDKFFSRARQGGRFRRCGRGCSRGPCRMVPDPLRGRCAVGVGVYASRRLNLSVNVCAPFLMGIDSPRKLGWL